MTEYLYPSTNDGACRMLSYIGDLFGQPLAARAVTDMLPFPDEYTLPAAWFEFIDLLKRCGAIDAAFANAWPPRGVVPFIIGMSVPIQDAEDINQRTAMRAFINIERYKPWLSQWHTWLLVIAKRLVYNMAASYHYRMVAQGGLEIEEMRWMEAEDSTVLVDDREIYLWATINDWLKRDKKQVIFAGLVELATLHNIKLTGEYAMQITHMSKTELYRLRKAFFSDVLARATA